MTTLLKDLIDIPTQVNQGDFVLNLSAGVTPEEAAKTLGTYVVTDRLVPRFDDALNFIQSAVRERVSKAAYLHGSFGAGKSHFMAVLHLLLGRNKEALGLPKLAPVVAKHNDWLEGKKFLLVPYHMINAHDVESAVLGGYVAHVGRRHPEAAIPGVYVAEPIFADARRLRARMGDPAFFEQLNEARADPDWGSLEAPWDAERFEAATRALPGSEERGQLVGDLVAAFFQGYTRGVASKGETYVSLDEGLAEISRHAHKLGYSALILFLDELILWLASRAADLPFVHREGQKLAKLVESQTADRPVPIISFVARQRDLRELVGENVTGADRLNFSDAFKHWEGRFHRITLEDRNLPEIAAVRLLAPREGAGERIDSAFERTAKARDEVMKVLLTREGDRAMFRQVYPFSPVLVQTLIAVSSALQRERTALKIMQMLLVEQRESLRLGDVVPVGDLFDAVAHGEESFNEGMRPFVEFAKTLYHRTLLPLLERQHKARREELELLPFHDPKRASFRADDRLVKTLLLAALLPEVEALRELTALRLAALNHGSVQTPIPGTEGQEVLRRLRSWAAEISEIKIGEGPNPTVSVQLTGINTETILAQAIAEDNAGNRSRRLRQLLFEQLGVAGSDNWFVRHTFSWRGTERCCEVVFDNVRKLPPSSLENDGADWKLIIDPPFDDPGVTPEADLAVLEEFQSARPQGARTLVWVPSFFSAQARKDLGRLVLIDFVLKEERFGQYTLHLTEDEKPQARQLLKNQQAQLTQRVKNHLEAAYGLHALTPDSVDPSHELADHFRSLAPGFEPRPPARTASMGAAMNDLLDQALSHQFPAHPTFEIEAKGKPLRDVLDACLKAARNAGGRLEVEDRNLRKFLRQIAVPLRLGEMHENIFVLDADHWPAHFPRCAAGGPLKVESLRSWFDTPAPMGLPLELQNLVLLVFAEQTGRRFTRPGTTVRPEEVSLLRIDDGLELRQQKLPPKAEWERAVARAKTILGLSPAPLLTAGNVARLAEEVHQVVQRDRHECQALVKRLRDRLQKLEIDGEASGRLKTASALSALVESLSQAEGAALVQALAAGAVATSEEAMGKSRQEAAAVSHSLASANWALLEEACRHTGEDPEAAAVRDDLVAILTQDELVTGLAAELKAVEERATRLLGRLVRKRPRTLTPEPPIAGQGPPAGREQGLNAEQAQALLVRLTAGLQKGQRLSLDISWRVEGAEE